MHQNIMTLTEDIIEVEQLVVREREARDRQWWSEMYRMFDPSATVKISWYQGPAKGFIEGSRKMSEGGNVAYHRLGPVSVRVNGDKAIATLSGAIELRTKLDNIEVDLDSYARFVYKAERKEGKWKLMSLNCLYQRDTLSPTIPGTSLHIEREKLLQYRKSYRFLSYIFEKNGFPVNQDLPGDDRPHAVEAIYTEAFSWAGLQDQLE